MILVVKNLFSNKQESFPLHKVEDFDRLFDLYPWSFEVALKSDSIADAAENIARYIDRSSTVIAYIHNEVAKSEEHAQVKNKADGLDIQSLSNFSTSLERWAKKRSEPSSHIARDTTFSPDPGKQRHSELDIDAPITLIDKIKQKIKEFGK